MEIAAIVLAVLSMGLSVFILLKASSNNHILNARIERLKDKIHKLEYRLNDAKGPANKGNRQERGQQDQPSEQRKKGQQPQPKQQQPKQQPNEQQQRRQQPNEQQQRRRQPDEQQQLQAPQQPRRQQAPEVQDQQALQQQRRQQTPEQLDGQAPQQPRRKKENRRREPRENIQREDLNQEQPQALNLEQPRDLNLEQSREVGLEQPEAANFSLDLENVGRELLAQLEMAEEAGNKKFSIIPEDGVIRGYQLQQRPDSDSYLEVDVPAENSSTTNYRFNLAGNHEFVIAQGIDRLENAFDFEKPSNRKVSQVVLQGDGVLAKVNNGWRIQEKARIDFR